jgi:hypothetical protein
VVVTQTTYCACIISENTKASTIRFSWAINLSGEKTPDPPSEATCLVDLPLIPRPSPASDSHCFHRSAMSYPSQWHKLYHPPACPPSYSCRHSPPYRGVSDAPLFGGEGGRINSNTMQSPRPMLRRRRAPKISALTSRRASNKLYCGNYRGKFL